MQFLWELFYCRYADVIVHRLLAASIGADATYPALLDKKQTQNIANNINYRHRYVVGTDPDNRSCVISICYCACSADSSTLYDLVEDY